MTGPAALLAHHLTVPGADRGYAWYHELYKLAAAATYHDDAGCTDPKGRRYLAAVIAPDLPVEDPDRITFGELAYRAYAKGSGIVILRDESPHAEPDAVLTFGSVWSFVHYADLGGCGNVVAAYLQASERDPVKPFEVVANPEDDNVSVGWPSEQFFPEAIKEHISQQIKTLVPEAAPAFNIYQRHKFAMPDSILISLECDWPIEQAQEILDLVSWYMPPYLPAMLAPRVTSAEVLPSVQPQVEHSSEPLDPASSPIARFLHLAKRR